MAWGCCCSKACVFPQKWHHAHGHVDTDVVLDSGGPRLYSDIFQKFTGGSLKTPAFVGAHQVLSLRSSTFMLPCESIARQVHVRAGGGSRQQVTGIGGVSSIALVC